MLYSLLHSLIVPDFFEISDRRRCILSGPPCIYITSAYRRAGTLSFGGAKASKGHILSEVLGEGAKRPSGSSHGRDFF